MNILLLLEKFGSCCADSRWQQAEKNKTELGILNVLAFIKYNTKIETNKIRYYGKQQN